MQRLTIENNFKILLVSSYELRRQPFGLASPAAWLRREGFQVTCADCAIIPLPVEAVQEADLVAFYVPMHTATRLAVKLLFRVKEINPRAHTCFYGLYAPMNENYLRRQGADTILGGEFEEGLLSLCKRLRDEHPRSITGYRTNSPQPEPQISLNRQTFILPDRQDLPPLDCYARLCCENNRSKVTGYTETTRGCKFHCRHCPVVPVYNGRFRIVQKEVVLADIRQQVAAGAEHITFGDPDFFNGPGHVLAIVEVLHEEFPHLTYDVTIKVEHLLKYRRHLPRLRDTGCALVTTAVESIDDRILQILDKGHSRQDFIQTVKLFEKIGLALNPTFVSFTPWITLEGYKALLALLNELELVGNVSPIQLAIRLLIPEGSRLLELPETQAVLGSFNEELLTYEWFHPDPQVDELHQEIMKLVNAGNRRGSSRREIFETLWEAVNQMLGSSEPLPKRQNRRARTTIPYLNEPWYC